VRLSYAKEQSKIYFLYGYDVGSGNRIEFAGKSDSSIAALPPGIKLGLSNIVTMYCLFFIGKFPAITIATLKSLFVLLTKGFTAGVLSLTGGLCALAVMILLNVLFREKCSYTMLSIMGGISNNIGQIAMASLILQTQLVLYYLPILLIGGLIAGLLTGTLLKIVMPALRRLDIK
jgi:heptaprenyl diphosphate synthase